MLYAILNKGKVILGPITWSQKYYTDVLRIRHRINANIPGNVPETMPYAIDENTTIHIVEENKPEFDAMTQYLYGPLWDTAGDIIIANYEVKEQNIESARNNFRIVAAHERYKKEVSNIKILVQGVEVTADTSRDGRAIFLQRLNLMEDTDVVNWKFPERWLQLTKTDLTAIVLAGAAHIQSAFDWEKNINDQIDSANTAEELHVIEIIEKPKSIGIVE